MQDTNHQSRITNHAGYEIRENDMLENKTTTIVGAALAAIVSLMFTASLLLAPSAALADDECGTQIDSGNPESFNCPDGSYGSGVTYTTDGDLTLNFNNGSVSNIGGVGIGVTGGGTDSVTVNSASTTTELDSAGATGALVGVTTVNGDIDIDVEELDADFAPTTHGIFAESTGTGSIFIDTIGTVDAQSGTNPSTSIGIEAITDSGGINLTTGSTVTGNMAGIQATSGSGDISMETSGTVGGFSSQYGIRAETGGAGTLTITAFGGVNVSNSIGVAAIEATTGTGLLTIDIPDSGSGSISGAGGTGGIGILTDAGGDVLIDVGLGRDVNAFSGIAMDLTAAGKITVNNAGQIRTGGSNADLLAIRAASDTFVLNNIGGASDTDGLIDGPIDFSGLENGYVFNNMASAIWDIGTGLATGDISTKSRISTLGAGVINNAGTIAFGQNKEVVLAQGASYSGSPGSVLEMPVIPTDLTQAGQTGCTPDTVTVAGCFNLSGGETSGQTSIVITTPVPALETQEDLTPAANLGILLVDVGGGTSAADHFVLDPGSENYRATSLYGPVITTGDPSPMVYALLYNPDTQQHILASVPSAEGIEYGSYIGEAMSIWHTTADTVVGRQADLRERGGRGGWARLVSESSERDTTLKMTTHGNAFAFDTDYERNTDALVFGFDAMYGDNYVIGLHGGLIESETDYDRTGNSNDIKAGAAVGVYGGWWRDNGISVDAAINVNFLTLDHINSYEVSHTDIRTMGLRAEAAWKYPLSESFYVQPLATVAYVVGRIETLELRANDIVFENEESQRAALGLRLGGDMDLSTERFTRLKYWLTARVWEEYAEDGSANYQIAGEQPLSIAEDISESFEEVALGASLTNAEGNISVFLSGNLQSGDRTDSTNVTIGARLRW